MLFEKIFLKSTIEKNNNESIFIISCWDTIIPQFHNEDFEFYDSKKIILPAKEPNYLTIILTFENQSSFFLEQLIVQLQQNKHFWKECLLYDVEFRIEKPTKSICIKLSCNLWFNSKIATLLNFPLQLKCYKKTDPPQIKYLNEIQIKGVFYKIYNKDKNFQKSEEVNVYEIKNLLNQFFSSLVISQLEFKFPLIFSSLVRNRIATQETYFAPISYCLTNSTRLIPVIIKIISKDRTSTTAFILLLPKKEISFKITLNLL